MANGIGQEVIVAATFHAHAAVLGELEEAGVLVMAEVPARDVTLPGAFGSGS